VARASVTMSPPGWIVGDLIFGGGWGMVIGGSKRTAKRILLD